MDAIKCIKTRRSRRLFLNKKVDDGIVNELLECALAAPSSQDCQPCEFILVKDRKIKKELYSLKDEDNQQHIKTAPLSIVVCVDKEKSPTRFVEDGVTATQNLLLAAHALGLGAVYVTGFKPSKPEVEENIRKILDPPKNIVPISIIPVGYADNSEKLDSKTLRKPKDVMHADKW